MFASKHNLNAFTTKLAAHCKANGTAHVKLRNTMYLDVIYQSQEDLTEDENSGFTTPDYRFSWRPDGSSCTRSEWDIIQCNDF